LNYGGPTALWLSPELPLSLKLQRTHQWANSGLVISCLSFRSSNANLSERENNKVQLFFIIPFEAVLAI